MRIGAPRDAGRRRTRSPRIEDALARRVGRRAGPPHPRLPRFLRAELDAVAGNAGAAARHRDAGRRGAAFPAPGRRSAKGDCRILDLGTGTGAIALALACRKCRKPRSYGADISADALATAQPQCRETPALRDRFRPLRSDWFEKFAGRFHAIVSNPPYIPAKSSTACKARSGISIRRRALDGGADGLDAYRTIAAQRESASRSRRQWSPSRSDTRRGTDVTRLFAAAGYRPRRGTRDLAGRDRVLVFALTMSISARAKKRLAMQANADRVPAPDETKQAVLSTIRFPETKLPSCVKRRLSFVRGLSGR